MAWLCTGRLGTTPGPCSITQIGRLFEASSGIVGYVAERVDRDRHVRDRRRARVAHRQRHRRRARDRLHGRKARVDHRDGERRVRFVRVLARPAAAATREQRRAGAYEQDGDGRMTPPHSEGHDTSGVRPGGPTCPRGLGWRAASASRRVRTDRDRHPRRGVRRDGSQCSRAGVPADEEPARGNRGHDDPDGQDHLVGSAPALPLWRRSSSRSSCSRCGCAGSRCWSRPCASATRRRGCRRRTSSKSSARWTALGGFFVLAAIREIGPAVTGDRAGRRRGHRDHRRPRRAQDPRGARRAAGARRGSRSRTWSCPASSR